MKSRTLAFTAHFLALGVAMPVAQTEALKNNTRTFVRLNLTEPMNWVAGNSLFPGRVIAGYNAGLDQYTSAEAWASYVLEKCKGFEACTSAYSVQGESSFLGG